MIPMTLKDVASAVGATHEAGDDCLRIRRVTTDSRDVQPGDLFFAIPGERFDGHEFIAEAASKGVVACVCNRDWHAGGAGGASFPIPHLVVEDTIEALGRLAAYYRRRVMHVATVVVAITGSNGKTTAKGMIDHVLCGSFTGRAAPKNFNNRLGVPLTLLSAEVDDRYLVVEIGTNAPGEVAALSTIAFPHAAVITSIGEAHLQGLGGMDGVAAEKVSLLRHVRPDGLAVVNIDRPEIRPHLATASRPRLVTVGTDQNASLRVADAHGDMRSTTFELDGRFRVELPMPGMHHATNAAATFAIARWFGIAPAEIIERLRSYVPPDGRTRRLEMGGVTVIDDAYNANPASMASAIETLRRGASGRRVLVMGDMLELGPGNASFHRQAVAAALEAGIDVLVAVGAAMRDAVQSMEGCYDRTRVVVCENAEAASDALMTILAAGDTVWIKGSRAVELDRVVSDLRIRLRDRKPQALVCADSRELWACSGK